MRNHEIPRPSSLLTRRGFIVGSLVLAGATACGSSDDGSSAAGSSTSSAPDGPASSAPTPASAEFPRQVEHLGGTVEVAARPSEVMTMRSFYDLDAVLAFGVVPTLVGTYPGRGYRAWQVDAGADEAALIDVQSGVNVEQVLADGIDLFIANEIVYTTFPEETDAVEQVGPLVGLPDFDFAEQLRIVGTALGVSPDEIQQRVDEVEAALDGFSVTAPPASIGALNYYGDATAFATTAESNTGALLERIGLPTLTAPEPPADQARKDYVELSLEVLAQVLDVDVLYGFEFDGGADAWDELEASPVFQAIPAVQNGRYFRLGPDEATAISAPSVLSVPVALAALSRTIDA